jgi:hypothetical protein
MRHSGQTSQNITKRHKRHSAVTNSLPASGADALFGDIVQLHPRRMVDANDWILWQDQARSGKIRQFLAQVVRAYVCWSSTANSAKYGKHTAQPAMTHIPHAVPRFDG